MYDKSEHRLKEIYAYAQAFLEKMCPSTVRLEKYLHNKRTLQSMTEICESMISSLANRNMLPGVIQFEERHTIFKELLCDFSTSEITATYTSESLYVRFQENFTINNSASPRNLWRLFAKSIISGCTFLNNFESPQEFDQFTSLFSENEFTRAALPMLLEKEIHGLGFALACDFLKELGYEEYPKPDVHLIHVFSALAICSKDPYDVYKATIEMAEVCEKSAYCVDKTIWLICSGNFYLDSIKINGKEKEFINSCKNR